MDEAEVEEVEVLIEVEVLTEEAEEEEEGLAEAEVVEDLDVVVAEVVSTDSKTSVPQNMLSVRSSNLEVVRLKIWCGDCHPYKLHRF